jgi:hypothetical protein
VVCPTDGEGPDGVVETTVLGDAVRPGLARATGLARSKAGQHQTKQQQTADHAKVGPSEGRPTARPVSGALGGLAVRTVDGSGGPTRNGLTENVLEPLLDPQEPFGFLATTSTGHDETLRSCQRSERP